MVSFICLMRRNSRIFEIRREKLAQAMQVPFLGKIRRSTIVQASDNDEPYLFYQRPGRGDFQ